MTDTRHDEISGFGRWWWTIDRWVLSALIALLALGIVLTMAAGPPAASRLGLDSFHFVRAQLTYLPLALVIMLGVSLLSPRTIRRLAFVAFILFFVLTALTPVLGAEIKGARRWLTLFGQSLQPSEFLKPTFAILIAWLFSEYRLGRLPSGSWIATGLCFAVIVLLVRQPDMGNSVLVAMVWFVEFFLAGLSALSMAALAAVAGTAATAAYLLVPHVAARVDAFLDPASIANYQVNVALEAFANGGLFGQGPGEGIVKASLPDAQSDFILAVAGEELGLIATIIIVALFAFIVLRGFSRLLEENDLFVLLGVSGLLTAFGVQALINMGSTLHIVPTKGITLPFISYGGSSALALALGMGMVLALTRRRARGGLSP